MLKTDQKIGIRWTMGDVSDRGFEALRLSVTGAFKIFGDNARYAICVNNIPLQHARHRTGQLPAPVIWRDAAGDLPRFLSERFDRSLAEGVGWKFAPLRLFPDCHEISLDNDCILWELPPSIRHWLEKAEPDRCLIAEDVESCFGQFTDCCDSAPKNAGIRGFPPGFDFEIAVRHVLNQHHARHGKPILMTSETDEQGLQTAALSIHSSPITVTVDEVTICSPFHPHLPHLGQCGAHFVGLNARHIAWRYFDRAADDCMTDHWNRHYVDLCTKLEIPPVIIQPEVSCEQL